jgi:hypothetical protein
MHRKRQNKKVKAVALVASAAAVAGLTVYGTSSALAGTNGQEVRLCQQGGADYTKASIFGTNQDGVETRRTIPIGPGCTPVEGFFWRQDITIAWTGGTRSRDEGTRCFVPIDTPENVIDCTIGVFE